MAKKIILTIALFAIVQPPAQPETIELKSGKKVTAVVLEKTNKYIKVDLDGKILYYNNAYIKDIKTGRDMQPAEDIAATLEGSYLEKGIQLGASGHFAEAKKQFISGLMSLPNDKSLQEAKQLIDDFEKGVISKEYALYSFRGVHAIMSRQFQEGIMYLKRLLDIKSNDPDVFFNLGIAYYQIEEFAQAVLYLKKAIELKPDDPEIAFNLAIAYYASNKYKEAIQYLNEARQENPNDPDVLFNLGTAYYQLNDYGKAIEYLKQTLILRPRDTQILFNLAVVYHTQEKYTEAINYLEKALALDPNDPDTYGVLGVAYYANGQHDKARDNFSKAQKLYEKKGDYKKAKDMQRLLN